MSDPVTDPVSAQVQPPLVLIKGDATEEEVAALVAAILNNPQTPVAPARHEPSERPASGWHHGLPMHPAPGGWRASSLPR